MPFEQHGVSEFAAGLLLPEHPVPHQLVDGSDRRYAVYRNNVTVGLVRALGANFPAVRKLLGAVYFDGLAAEFARRHPPRSPLLFQYGQGFAEFIAACDDLAGYPYLPDVARLEQLWRQAHHAADAPVLAPDRLSSLDGESLMAARFLPHPSLALLSSAFAVHSIFAANRGEAVLVARPGKPECVVVTRPRFDVVARRIGPSDYRFLMALAGGEMLGDAAEQCFASDPAFDLAAAVRLMVEAGAFQDMTTGDQS